MIERIGDQDLAVDPHRHAARAGELCGSEYSPSLEVAFRIAEVFAVPLEEVFQYGGGEK